MQVTMNINLIRHEHTNKRDAGVLPRDHDDQKLKKSFVGWDQDSSSAKDQGKNNMATERLTEKSMRKPGEDQSLVVKQEYLSNNVERDTKPKTVVDYPTGYDPFLVGSGDINQDDPLSKEKKKGGRSTPYSDPSKNFVDSVARTSSPLEKKKKGDKISDIGGSSDQLHPDHPSKIMTATRVGRGVQHSENVAAPTYLSSNGPVVEPQTQSHSENKTVGSFSATIPSNYEKEKTGMTAMRMTPGDATMLSNERYSKDNAGKIQNADPPKTTATHVGVQSKNESVSSSRTSTQPHGDQNTTFESIPQTPSFEKEKKATVEVESKTTAMISSSKPQSQGENATSFDNRVLRKIPSKDQKENKDDGRGTQYSNSPSKANATNRVEADHYVANKDIGVALVPTNKPRGKNTSTTTGRPYEKPKKGGCSCSVL